MNEGRVLPDLAASLQGCLPHLANSLMCSMHNQQLKLAFTVLRPCRHACMRVMLMLKQTLVCQLALAHLAGEAAEQGLHHAVHCSQKDATLAIDVTLVLTLCSLTGYSKNNNNRGKLGCLSMCTFRQTPQDGRRAQHS
jgi:hypothetical protein